MSSHPVARSDFRRSRARRLNCRTAVSVLALALGLTACASGPQSPAATDATGKSAMLLKIADETSAAGDPATAASLYRELHDLAPTDPVPLARLAATSMAMQDYRTAAEAYRAALALDRNNADYHRGLALALLVLGDAQGAMTEIRAALEKHGDDPRLYNALGVAEDMSGRHDLAQQAYHHGLDVAPSNAGLRNNYAMSLALAGDYTHAVQELGDIAKPEAPARYRLNLALAYGLAGDDAHAAATARQVLDEASVQNNLAYYGLLRGMDEAHRTAAIIATELHGSGAAQVAEASAKAQTSRADAAPSAASTAPVAAAVLPPPLPTPDAEAKADLPSLPFAEPAAPPRHVASLSPKARPAPAAAAPKSTASAASDAMPKTAPTAQTAAAEPPAPVETADKTAPQSAATAPAAMAAEKTPAADTASDASPKVPAAMAADQPPPPAPPAASVATDPTPETATVSPANAPDAPAPVAATEPAARAPDPVPAGLDTSGRSPQPATQKVSPQSGVANPSAAQMDEAVTVAAPAATPAATADTLAALTAPAQDPAFPSSDTVRRPHPARPTVERFTVQLGSFALKDSAHRVADYFAAKGVVVAISRSSDRDGREWFVVRSGEFDNADDANGVLGMIRSMGLIEPIVVRHRIAEPAAPAA